MGSKRDVMERHIYWFKFWRWWRGNAYRFPSVTTAKAHITVLGMDRRAIPAVWTTNTFIEWNTPKTLHEFFIQRGIHD